MDRLRKSQPSLVGDVVGELVPIGLLQRVLKNLLRSGLPIRQLTVILESLGECAHKTKNAALLTEVVRKALSRAITDMFKNDNGKICAIALSPVLEHQLCSCIKQDSDEITLMVPSETAMDLCTKVASAWKAAMDNGTEKPVVLCDSRLRAGFANLIARTVPSLPVIAYDEITLGTDIQQLETVSASIPADQRQNNKNLAPNSAN